MNNKKYFFDPQVVAYVNDAQLQISTVLREQKTTTDAIWVDRYQWTPECEVPDWEQRTTILYPYVMYDPKGISVDGVSDAKYKMWYNSLYDNSPMTDYDWRNFLITKTDAGEDAPEDGIHAKGQIYKACMVESECLCYMESNDGIHWRRPDCGEFYYRQQNGEIVGTNIVYISGHGCGVVRNTNPDPKEPRFLMATMAVATEDSFGGLGISWSEDGIHWEEPVTIKTRMQCEDENMELNCDTHNQVFWSAEQNAYICLTRGTSDGQTIRHVVQFASLPGLSSIRQLAKIRDMGGSYWKDSSEYWSTPTCVLQGRLGSEPYSVPCGKIAEGYYIGLVSDANFQPEGEGVCYSVHCELAWSRNGSEWNFLCKGSPFIPNEATFRLEPGNDYGMIFAAAPIETENGIEVFYAATPELHYMRYDQIPKDIKKIVDSRIPAAAAVTDSQGKVVGAVTRSTALNRVKLGKDRYAGYYAKQGEVVTTFLQMIGEEVRITADVEAGGSVRMAVLDLDGNEIAGYGMEDCAVIRENVTDCMVTWKGINKSPLKGNTICFRIRLEHAKIYTLSGDIAL